MPGPVDKEIGAIKKVLAALEPLSSAARSSVLEYAIKRLDIYVPTAAASAEVALTPVSGASVPAESVPQGGEPIHIKAFKELKKPRSANEMAALVAYYLANLAPPADRKQAISAKDIETYFKIGGFPLPNVQFTLPNAKNAGYFDPVGNGAYKLNAVGHNLIVHGLPRSSASADRARRRPPKKARSKPAKRK